MGHVTLHLRKAEGTKARRVWEIADELAGESGTAPGQPAVVARFTAEGGNANTGRTEYVNWLRAYEKREDEPDPHVPLWKREPGNIDRLHLTIASDGRLLIPAAMREAMLLDTDGKVTAHVVDGELRVIAPAAAIRKAQKIARKYKKPGESVVDEFLAERRTMWGEE